MNNQSTADGARATAEPADARVLELLTTLHDRVVQPLAAASLALSIADLDEEDRIRAGSAVTAALDELQTVLAAAAEELEAGSAADGLESALATEELESGSAAEGPESGSAADGLEPAVATEAARGETAERLATVVRSVVAEALSNAGKHGGASEVTIAVHGREDGLVMLDLLSESVRAASNGRRGVGLRLAALAARSVGATLEVGPADTGHWRVRMCVPS